MTSMLETRMWVSVCLLLVLPGDTSAISWLKTPGNLSYALAGTDAHLKWDYTLETAEPHPPSIHWYREVPGGQREEIATYDRDTGAVTVHAPYTPQRVSSSTSSSSSSSSSSMDGSELGKAGLSLRQVSVEDTGLYYASIESVKDVPTSLLVLTSDVSMAFSYMAVIDGIRTTLIPNTTLRVSSETMVTSVVIGYRPSGEAAQFKADITLTRQVGGGSDPEVLVQCRNVTQCASDHDWWKPDTNNDVIIMVEAFVKDIHATETVQFTFRNNAPLDDVTMRSCYSVTSAVAMAVITWVAMFSCLAALCYIVTFGGEITIEEAMKGILNEQSKPGELKNNRLPVKPEVTEEQDSNPECELLDPRQRRAIPSDEVDENLARLRQRMTALQKDA